MGFTRVTREGFITGLIGAGTIALWFLVIDSISGQPFYTPALIGQALWGGLRDPALVEVTFQTVVGYTLIHIIAFIGLGMVAAGLVAGVERAPQTLFLVVVLFAAFEFGFYIVMLVIARPILTGLAWWSVALANLIAALTMGLYLWTCHPRLRERLARHPLGDPSTIQ